MPNPIKKSHNIQIPPGTVMLKHEEGAIVYRDGQQVAEYSEQRVRAAMLGDDQDLIALAREMVAAAVVADQLSLDGLVIALRDWRAVNYLA